MKKVFIASLYAIMTFTCMVYAAQQAKENAKASLEQKPLEKTAIVPELQMMSPLDVKDADIQDVIRTISKGYNVNIILDKDVTGKVTVHLSDVPVLEGLRTLARSIGLEVVKEGNVYRIRKATDEQRSVITYINNKLTVDVQNIDVKDFLKDISAKTAISIVPDAKVSGKITGKLVQVDLDDGLRALLQGSGLKLTKRKNIYQVLADDDATPANAPAPPGSPYPGYRRMGGGPGGGGSTSFFVECANGKISLDVVNGNLNDVIKAIAEQSDMEIITYGTISGEINAKLKNVPLTQALALLLGGTMFTFVQKDSIILIGDRNAATPSGQALSKSELIHLNCIKADGVMQILPKDIPPSNVKVIKEQNALLVSGTSEDIVSVREFISTIDVPTPQVSIDAVIVEYSENLSNSFNVKANLSRPDLAGQGYFSTPSSGFALDNNTTDATELNTSGAAIKNFLQHMVGLSEPFGSNNIISHLPDNFFIFLKFLESQSQAKVLAQPSLVTLNGNKASINVNQTKYFKVTTGNPLGGDYSIRFQPITFGIKLDITPWISMGGQITAEIAPEVSNSDGNSADGYPNVSTRSISTTVRLNNGETIILGGLVQNQQSETKEKIPILGDIPFIGFLFRTNAKTRIKSNLVVYITPHILTPQTSSADLKKELSNFEKNDMGLIDKKNGYESKQNKPMQSHDKKANPITENELKKTQEIPVSQSTVTPAPKDTTKPTP